MSYNVELLAPAGNAVCLRAAVRAGANAVYLGTDDFNARRGADNFTLESLAEACDWAHMRGVRIYLTLNIVILPSELEVAVELARQAWRAGVDAFIIQDIGLADRVRSALPDAEIHISTQMNTHNEAGVAAAAKLGAKRVTLARELAYSEIDNLCTVAHAANMEIETFAHGALCICYSGQCFASSMVGGRSANRGMCAQACRLPYTLHNKATNRALPAEGEHLLSPKDLCTLDVLPELVACGVDSLKIEGRMKSPEYVYAVVSTYRSVLDRTLAWLANDENFSENDAVAVPESLRPTEEEHRAVDEAFSRGFTTAYLTGDTGAEMMSVGRPNNRGAFLGRVARVGDGLVEIDCDVPVVAGDVIEFWTGKGHFAHTLDAFEVVDSQRAGGMRIRLSVPKKVGKGDRVFRVRSAAAAFVDNEFEPKVVVQAHVELHLNQPARLALTCDEAFNIEPVQVVIEGKPVEAARTKALIEEEVREHIDRFGGTPFELGAIQVDMDEGIGMGFSQLHALRAEAAQALQDAMLASYKSRTLIKQPKQTRTTQMYTPTTCEVCVVATNPACARAARKAGADAVYVPVLNYKRGQAMVAGQLTETVEQAGYPNRAIPMLPTVEHDQIPGTREATFGFDAWKYVKPGKKVLVDSLAQVYRAHELDCEVEVGAHVPVTNAASAELLQQWGVARVWLSPELTLGQIQAIAERADVPLGLTIIGQQELMVTEHCLLTSQGPCNRDCTTCARRKSPHYLKDRKDYEMPVVTDCVGRSHLYNAITLDVAHAAPDLLAAGVSAFMVDATLMTVEQTRAATERAVRARDLALRGAGAVGRVQGTTTGHLFRSIS